MFSLISVVHAGDVNVIDVPQKVGESLGIPEPNTAFVGGLFMSMIVLLGFTLPTLLVKKSALTMIMMFLVLGFCTSVGWLDAWFMIVIVLIIAGSVGWRLRRLFS